MSRTHLRIGEAAQLLGITPKTLRHYERRGLLPDPARSESDYRLYTADDLLRLRHIRQLQAMGLSLEQIKAVFDAPDPDAALQTTLQRLRASLESEQARIAARLERVSHYLRDEAPLSEVVRPPGPSLTYAAIRQALPADLPTSPTAEAFDEQVFAEFDSFAWGKPYADLWAQAAGLLVATPALYALMVKIADRIESAAGLDENAPELAQWAAEIAQTPDLEALQAQLCALGSVPDPHAEIMRGLFERTMHEQLTAGQRRLLDLVTALMTP